MKTSLIQSVNSIRKMKKLILILVITLISFPAMALLLSGDKIEIEDSCVQCGLCETLYPDSFFVPYVEGGKAAILVGYDIQEVYNAREECPVGAIKINGQ